MENKVRIKSIRSRPRFKVYTKSSKEDLIVLIKKHLALNKQQIGGYANQEFAMVRLRKDKEKYWAPQLQIRWETDDDHPNFIVVRGIIGPKSNVWTMFMFLYGFAGVLLLTLGTFSISEYIVKGESIWIWSIPISILIGTGTYLATKLGQKIAKEHLVIINEFVDNIFRETKFYEDDKDAIKTL